MSLDEKFQVVSNDEIRYAGDVINEMTEGLREGQIIVLGTDGIWDAQNPKGKMFGKETLCEIIKENPDAEANVLLVGTIEALDQFRDGFSLQDDVTLIAVKIEKN